MGGSIELHEKKSFRNVAKHTRAGEFPVSDAEQTHRREHVEEEQHQEHLRPALLEVVVHHGRRRHHPSHVGQHLVRLLSPFVGADAGSTSKAFFEQKDKETEVKGVVFDKGPLKKGFTQCDLGGRQMVAGAAEAQIVRRYADAVATLDSRDPIATLDFLDGRTVADL